MIRNKSNARSSSFLWKNFKVHWRNINKDINKKTGMPLWKTLTVIKMSISLKLMYRFSTIPTNILTRLFSRNSTGSFLIFFKDIYSSCTILRNNTETPRTLSLFPPGEHFTKLVILTKWRFRTIPSPHRSLMLFLYCDTPPLLHSYHLATTNLFSLSIILSFENVILRETQSM